MPAHRRAGLVRVIALIGAIAAAQLCTTGIVAAKHWHPLSGMTGFNPARLSTLVTLAEMLVAVAGAAAVTCLVVVRTAGIRRTGEPGRYRWATLVLGVLVATALPFVLGSGDPQAAGVRSLAAYALLYSLPWGAVIAVSGWLPRAGALAALATIALSAMATDGSHAVLWVPHPTRGFAPAVIVALALVAMTAARPARAPLSPSR